MQYYLASLFQFGDWGLLALRIAVGVIFLYHGVKKFGMWKMAPSPQMPIGMLWIMRFLSVAEPIGGLAVLLGFMAQSAAIGLGIIMLGAIWLKIKKWGIPFSASDKGGWEFDFIILAACVAILFLGAGSWSIDKFIFWV